MSKKLHRCDICMRPTILYEMTADKPMNGPQYQGPKTHPKIKRWCRGSCFPVHCPLMLEIDSLETFIKETKKPLNKEFAQYVLKRLRGVAKEQLKSLKEMAKDLS